MAVREIANQPLQPANTESYGRLKAAGELSVAIVSDAIAGRNGVGTYYLDLIDHLSPLVKRIQLIGPEIEPERDLERWSIPLPGDASQRICFPRSAELSRRLDDQSPDLIVIPTIGPFSYYAWKYAVKRSIPFVMVHHTNFEQLLSLYWPDIVAAPLRWALTGVYSSVIRQAAAVAAMNSEAFEQAQELGADVVRVMGTPIPSMFTSTPHRKRQCPPKRVVFVGRLAAEKGIDDLLQAATECPEIQFAIVGDGPLRDRVRRCCDANVNVRWLGWKSRAEVLEQIDAADVLVLPSSLETFGTVALEALARERFVLVQRSCGIAKWPSISKGLFFIEPDEAISDSIRRLASMPAAERDEIASRSWEATRDFNDYTIRVWLRFLTDTVGAAEDEAG